MTYSILIEDKRIIIQFNYGAYLSLDYGGRRKTGIIIQGTLTIMTADIDGF